jgi:histidinol dehydrogenase
VPASALAELGPATVALAEAEGLWAHAQSAALRVLGTKPAGD